MDSKRIELCKKCKKCSDVYLISGMSEGCSNWHRDKKFGGCTEFIPKEKYNNGNPALNVISPYPC